LALLDSDGVVNQHFRHFANAWIEHGCPLESFQFSVVSYQFRRGREFVVTLERFWGYEHFFNTEARRLTEGTERSWDGLRGKRDFGSVEHIEFVEVETSVVGGSLARPWEAGPR
jgi:hypothetical protein